MYLFFHSYLIERAQEEENRVTYHSFLQLLKVGGVRTMISCHLLASPHAIFHIVLLLVCGLFA